MKRGTFATLALGWASSQGYSVRLAATLADYLIFGGLFDLAVTILIQLPRYGHLLCYYASCVRYAKRLGRTPR